MISTLALSILGSWSYAGFLAEPVPARAPAPASISLAPEPVTKPVEPARKEIPTPPIAPAKKPVAPPPPIPPAPTLYRLTDASGQTWEHPDPTYLSSFVEARDQWFSSASPAAFVPDSTYVDAPATSRFGFRRRQARMMK